MYFQIISASPNFITEAKKCWVYWPELVMISIQMDCVCVISGSDLQVLLVSNSCQHMFIFKSFPKQYLNLSISPVHCRYRPVGHLVVCSFLYYSSVKALLHWTIFVASCVAFSLHHCETSCARRCISQISQRFLLQQLSRKVERDSTLCNACCNKNVARHVIVHFREC